MAVVPTYCISSKEFDDDVQCCALPEFYWITNHLPMKFGLEDCVLIELDDNDEIKPQTQTKDPPTKEPFVWVRIFGRRRN